MSAHTRPSTPGIWASGVAEMDAHEGWLGRRRPSAATNATAVARREERLLLAWWGWRSRSDTADPFLVDRESLHDIEACSNGQRSPVATGDVFPPACDPGRPPNPWAHAETATLRLPVPLPESPSARCPEEEIWRPALGLEPSGKPRLPRCALTCRSRLLVYSP